MKLFPNGMIAQGNTAEYERCPFERAKNKGSLGGKILFEFVRMKPDL
jgi:hypothetical protein